MVVGSTQHSGGGGSVAGRFVPQKPSMKVEQVVEWYPGIGGRCAGMQKRERETCMVAGGKGMSTTGTQQNVNEQGMDHGEK